MNSPLMLLHPNDVEIKDIGDSLYSVTHKLQTELIEAEEKNIVDAICAAAKEAGVTDLYLLDKKFIFEAIQEKQERERNKAKYKKDCCSWCSPNSEYTVIDDDFGQPIHPSMVKYCFNCGRELRKEKK